MVSALRFMLGRVYRNVVLESSGDSPGNPDLGWIGSGETGGVGVNDGEEGTRSGDEEALRFLAGAKSRSTSAWTSRCGSWDDL